MNCFDLLNKETSQLVSICTFIPKRWKGNLVILFHEPPCSEKKVLLIKALPVNKVFDKLTTCLGDQMRCVILPCSK